MKNIFFLALMFFLLSAAYGQKNFAPLGAEWKYEGWDFACDGNHIKYTVTSEQLIDDKDCSWITSYHWSDGGMAWEAQDSLLIWENEQQVYFHAADSFYLLYNFNAEAGDTIMAYDPVDKTLFSVTSYLPGDTLPHLIPYLVEEVGEIDISGTVLKTYNTASEFYFMGECIDRRTVIENIGSTSENLIGTGCLSVTAGCFGNIVCYRNESIYYESGFLSCDSLTNVREIALANEFKVFPNPTTGLFQLEQPDFLTIESYQITDTNGRILSVEANINAIDLTGFPKGIYYLQLHLTSGENIFKKIIKQ